MGLSRHARVRRQQPPVVATGGLFLLGAVCLVGLACATGRASDTFERNLESGDYAAAVERFRGDSVLQRQEEALYQMGLLFASPADSFYSPAYADSLFRRLLKLYPDTKYRIVAKGFRALLDTTLSREARVDALQKKIKALKAISTGQAPDTSGS